MMQSVPPGALPPEHQSVDGVDLHRGAFAAAAGLAPPSAFMSGALYSVYPRAFSRAGTLAAVQDDLPRIAGLGACAVWLLPVHPIGELGRKGSVGCPYSVRDYRAVDPALGTVDDLRALVRAAHDHGLRVLIDLVANHAANDHPLAETHPHWISRDAEGRPRRRYADWSDVADWNFDEPEAFAHLLESAVGWVRDVGIDGFRCDVAGMVPLAFWRALHERLLEVNPEHFMLAEWQNAEHHTVAFHASYDWVLYRALRDTALGRTSASAVSRALVSWSDNFPARALPLRFLENHDEPRALAVFGRERLAAFAAVAFLSGGLPLIYNGQEAGAVHRPSLFEAEPIVWPAEETGWTRLYRELLELQRGGDPWGPGAVTPVTTDQPEGVVAFTRGGERGVLLANLGRQPLVVRCAGGAGHRYRVRFSRACEVSSWSPAAETVTLAPGAVWVGERA